MNLPTLLRFILIGLLALTLVACGTSASPSASTPPVDVTATYSAAKQQILAQHQSTTSPTVTTTPTMTPTARSTSTADIATATGSTIDPTATTSLRQTYDVDAVPEVMAPAAIKRLTMPETMDEVLILIDQLPASIGDRTQVTGMPLYAGEYGSWGTGYAAPGSSPPSYIDLIMTHIPSYATSTSVPEPFKIPADWDAAMSLTYQMSGGAPGLHTDQILSSGRDGDLFWLLFPTPQGGLQLQWGYRGSVWEYAVNGGSQADLDAILDTLAADDGA